MAPPHVRFEGNPVEILTTRGARVIGRLIEDWSTSADTRPKTARQEGDGRLLVMDVNEFKTILSSQPEEDRLSDRDFKIHPNVKEVELVLPRKDRFTICLPDPEAIAHQKAVLGRGHAPAVTLPTVYALVDSNATTDGWLELRNDAEAEEFAAYEVRLNTDDPLDVFLRPYMAAYTVAQCT